MKAAVTYGRGDVMLAEVPVPDPGPYQCLCRMLACATCTGTDRKIMTGTMPFKQNYPGILGHESVGTVLSMGDKVRYIQKGDIYLRPTAVYQGSKLGDYFSLWGGFAEYGLITDVKALKEDNPAADPGYYAQFQMNLSRSVDIPPAQAIMLITLKETAGYVADMKITLNNSVVVLGAGSVAMAMCMVSKMRGAFPLIVAARRDAPLEHIRRFGANFTVNNTKEEMVKTVLQLTEGKGVDYVIDTAGDKELFAEACGMLAEGGRIAPYATFTSADALKGIDEAKILWGQTGEVPAHNYLLDLVRMHAVNPEDFYSHSMPFADIAKGFAMIQSKEAFKVVFEM